MANITSGGKVEGEAAELVLDLLRSTAQNLRLNVLRPEVKRFGQLFAFLPWRERKAAARKTADPTTGAPAALKYTACPAGCGTFLMDDHPSYAPPGQPKHP